MFDPGEFSGILSLLKSLPESGLTEAEQEDVKAVLRAHYEAQVHEPRMAAIVDRLTAPKPQEQPKSRKGR